MLKEKIKVGGLYRSKTARNIFEANPKNTLSPFDKIIGILDSNTDFIILKEVDNTSVRASQIKILHKNIVGVIAFSMFEDMSDAYEIHLYSSEDIEA